jgi:hypothetical protein
MGAEAAVRGLGSRKAYPADAIEAACEASPKVGAEEVPERVVARLAAATAQASQHGFAALCDGLHARSYKRHKPSVLHLVAPEEFPFASALPWESAELVGLSVPVAAAQSLALPDDRRPDLLVADGGFDGRTDLPSPRITRLRLGYRALAAEATADLVAACLIERVVPVWIAAPEEPVSRLVGNRLDDAGIPRAAEEPDAPARIIVAPAERRPFFERLRAEDVVILLGGGPELRPLVDAARRRGTRVLRPPIGATLGARAAALCALRMRLDGPLSGERPGEATVVDPLLAPASGEAVVDDVALPSRVVDAGDHAIEELAAPLAARRARSLLSGQGAL